MLFLAHPASEIPRLRKAVKALIINPNFIAIEIEIRLAHVVNAEGFLFRQQLSQLLSPLRSSYLHENNIPAAARRSFVVRDSQHRYLAGLDGWREGGGEMN